MKSFRLIQLTVLLSASAIGFPTLSHADGSPAGMANELLGAFSSSCPSVGVWTDTALGFANTLVSVIQDAAKDPNCTSINGVLGQTQNIASQIAVLKQQEGSKELLQLTQQEQEIELQLSSTTDPTQQSLLENQLGVIETEMESYTGDFPDADQAYLNEQTRGDQLQTLVTNTNTFLSQISANTQCLENNTSILPAVASLAGSVQAVAMTGGSSLIAAAGADILNSFVENSRTAKIGRQINKMASSITRVAFQCVIESLSTQYCSTQDALAMIRLKGQAYTQPAVHNSFNDEINLLDKDLPNFLNWLTDVRSGTLPANAATAGNQDTTYDRENDVRKAIPTGLGILKQYQPVFDSASDEEGKWKIEKTVIDAIVGSLTGCGGNGLSSSYQGCGSPLADIHNNAIAPWYLLGISDANAPLQPGTGAPAAIDNYSLAQLQALPGLSTFQPDLGFVKTQLYAWSKDARLRVNTELALYVNLDPVKLLNDAISKDQSGDSPYNALLRLEAFMKSTPPPAAAGSFNRIYSDTLVRLSIIQKAIESVVDTDSTPPTPNPSPNAMASSGSQHPNAVPSPDPSTIEVPDHSPADATLALTNIQDAAVLDNGVGFLGDRINWALKQDLTRMLTGNETGIDPAVAAQLLASDDIIAQLESFTDDKPLGRIGIDIQNSQPALVTTLKNVFDEFGPSINQAIYDLESQAKLIQEDASGSNNQEVAELCLDALAAPTWPNGLPQNVCLGRTLNSVAFTNGPASLSTTITQDLINEKWDKRVCAFRDYQRINDIFQATH